MMHQNPRPAQPFRSARGVSRESPWPTPHLTRSKRSSSLRSTKLTHLCLCRQVSGTGQVSARGRTHSELRVSQIVDDHQTKGKVQIFWMDKRMMIKSPMIVLIFLALQSAAHSQAPVTNQRASSGTLRQVIPGHYVYSTNNEGRTFSSGIVATSDGVAVFDALASEAIAG